MSRGYRQFIKWHINLPFPLKIMYIIRVKHTHRHSMTLTDLITTLKACVNGDEMLMVIDNYLENRVD